MHALLALLLALQTPFATRSLTAEGGPEVRVHTRASRLVSIRVSAPLPEGLDPASVELLLSLARPRAEREAARIGAALRLERTPQGAVLAVTGAATAFDELVAILRRATGEPDLSAASLRSARARAADRLLSVLERPGPRLESMLWNALHTSSAASLPSPATLEGIGPEGVRRARALLFTPGRLRVVLVGSVPDEVVRSAVSHWSEPGAPPLSGEPLGEALVPPDPDSARGAPDSARVQVHHHWAGLGYPLPRADDATLVVAAALVDRRVRQSAVRGRAEAWLEPGLRALVVTGAAVPGDAAVATAAAITSLPVEGDPAGAESVTGRYLRRLIAEAAALTGPVAVAEAAEGVRRQILLEARTGEGRSDVIGRFANTDPTAADPVAGFLSRLREVDLRGVRALLHEVLEAPATVVEVRP